LADSVLHREEVGKGVCIAALTKVDGEISARPVACVFLYINILIGLQVGQR